MKFKSKLLSIILMLVIISSQFTLFSYANDVATNVNSNILNSNNEQNDYSLQDKDIPSSLKYSDLLSEGCEKRIYEKETDLNQAVFQNNDGTYTSYFFDENIKYYDENGELKNKDNIISLLQNGNYSNISNDIVAEFPSSIENGINIHYSNYQIKMTPIVDNSNLPQKINVCSENNSDDNYALYNNVFNNDISIKYTPLYSGIKEDIVINQKTVINEFKFELETNGLTLIRDETGTYLALNQSEDHIINIGDIYIYDSNGKSVFGQLKIEELEKNSKYIITIIVPQDYLLSNDISYPVTVDPSFTICQGESDCIYDATIFTNYNTNFGTWISLFVGDYDEWYGSTSRGTARTLVRFPAIFSSYGNGFYNLCLDHLVLSTKYVFFDISPETSTNVIDAYYMTTSWQEDTVVYSSSIWNSYGDYIDSFKKYSITGEIRTRYELDITEAAYDWGFGNRSDYGIMLKASDETIESMVMGSSQHYTSSSLPYVSVRYISNENPSSGIANNTDYYIMNSATDNYMRLLDNSNVSGTNVLASSKLETSLYQWKTELVSGTTNTYQLISIASSDSKVLDISGSNVDLWTDYNISCQKFVILRINTWPYQGLYTIKYGNYYISENPSTHNVYTTTTFSQYAVWSLMAVNKRDADLFNFQYTGFNTTNTQSDFSTCLTNSGYNTYCWTNDPPSSAYFYMQNDDDIFTFRGHGGSACIEFHDSSGAVIGYIAANDLGNPQVNNRYIDNLNDNDLALLRCALYIGCSTGVDDASIGTHYNIVDSTYDKGAHFVLGTTDTVYTTNGDAFLTGFLQGITLGFNIQDCIEQGLRNAGIVHLPSSDTYGDYPIVYSGDTYQYLN